MKRTHALSIGVAAVSLYLFAVGAWLVLTRRIKVDGVGKLIRRMFRPSYAGELQDFRRDDGHCWVASVPPDLLSDKEGASHLMVYEDDRRLGPAHSSYEDVRQKGGGRFTHWGPEVYFSTTDHSDPRTNGRRYYVKEESS
ncbi:MAG: hypothetical protein NW703_03295 [Nitrospiraceae bacterium]